MMRGYKCGLLLMVLSCWVAAAVADPAASAVAASAVKAIPSPEEDYQEAIKADKAGELLEAGILFRRAAERGHAAAQAEIAAKFEYATAYKEALEFYRKSAEQGNAAGQFGLGLTYAMGNPEVKQDLVEARKWIVLAANQGYPSAINMLAEAYMKGGLGLDEKVRSGPDAAVWIKRAAEINYVPAIRALIRAYRSGQYGLEVDPKQANDLESSKKGLLGIREEKRKKPRF